MANFIRCKQDNFSYKYYSEEYVGDKIKVFLFLFKTVESVYELKEKKSDIIPNILVNLDLVTGLSKCQGAYVRSEDGEYTSTGYGIIFNNASGGSAKWLYDSESDRDAQFEEIASNSHLFKQKVSI
jgi:hypothetical protein